MVALLRKEAIAAVAAYRAGIQVKMMTGNHAITAKAIAARIGLSKHGKVLALTEQELTRME